MSYRASPQKVDELIRHPQFRAWVANTIVDPEVVRRAKDSPEELDYAVSEALSVRNASGKTLTELLTEFLSDEQIDIMIATYRSEASEVFKGISTAFRVFKEAMTEASESEKI